MVNKNSLKKGDILQCIPYEEKGNTQSQYLEILDIYEVAGKKRFLCFSLTNYLSYPGCPDLGREIVFTEDDLINLEKID